MDLSIKKYFPLFFLFFFLNLIALFCVKIIRKTFVFSLLNRIAQELLNQRTKDNPILGLKKPILKIFISVVFVIQYDPLLSTALLKIQKKIIFLLTSVGQFSTLTIVVRVPTREVF